MTKALKSSPVRAGVAKMTSLRICNAAEAQLGQLRLLRVPLREGRKILRIDRTVRTGRVGVLGAVRTMETRRFQRPSATAIWLWKPIEFLIFMPFPLPVHQIHIIAG